LNLTFLRKFWNFDVTHGFNLTYNPVSKCLKGIELSKRLELDNGYVNSQVFLIHSKNDDQHKVNLDKWNVG